jgi:hypothetical protein
MANACDPELQAAFTKCTAADLIAGDFSIYAPSALRPRSAIDPRATSRKPRPRRES